MVSVRGAPLHEHFTSFMPSFSHFAVVSRSAVKTASSLR